MEFAKTFVITYVNAQPTSTIINLRNDEGDSGQIGYDNQVGLLAGLPVDIKNGDRLNLVFYTGPKDGKHLSFMAIMDKHDFHHIGYGPNHSNFNHVTMILDLEYDGLLSDYYGQFILKIAKQRTYRKFKKALQPMTYVLIRVE